MSRPKGMPQFGGRKKDDPNIHHSMRRGRMKLPKPASQRVARHGGKIPLSFSVSPNLYETLRLEALATNRTLSSVALQCLEAGMDTD